jgi:uncharacterized Zn finger protein
MCNTCGGDDFKEEQIIKNGETILCLHCTNCGEEICLSTETIKEETKIKFKD